MLYLGTWVWGFRIQELETFGFGVWSLEMRDLGFRNLGIFEI